jgi:hypothetical protein
MCIGAVANGAISEDVPAVPGGHDQGPKDQGNMRRADHLYVWRNVPCTYVCVCGGCLSGPVGCWSRLEPGVF